MKKIFKIASVILTVMFMISCVYTVPLTATSNPVGSKTGEASATFLFDAIPLGSGDFSIQKAALEGGISEISTIDIKKTIGFLFLTMKYTTIVTGE